MSFEILAYGVQPSLGEYLHAQSAAEDELPALPEGSSPHGLESLLSEEMRRRKLFTHELALEAERAEGESLGNRVEAILLQSARQYQLTRVVKRNGSGWHLLMEYRPNGSIEGFRDVHLDENLLGGNDSDRGRLERLSLEALQFAVLDGLRQQEPMRSTG